MYGIHISYYFQNIIYKSVDVYILDRSIIFYPSPFAPLKDVQRQTMEDEQKRRLQVLRTLGADLLMNLPPPTIRV